MGQSVMPWHAVKFGQFQLKTAEENYLSGLFCYILLTISIFFEKLRISCQLLYISVRAHLNYYKLCIVQWKSWENEPIDIPIAKKCCPRSGTQAQRNEDKCVEHFSFFLIFLSLSLSLSLSQWSLVPRCSAAPLEIVRGTEETQKSGKKKKD